MQLKAFHREPFQFRAQRQTVMVLHLLVPDHPQFLELLQAKVEKARKFFADAPIVIDATGLTGKNQGLSLGDVASTLRNSGLAVVAVQACEPAVGAEAALLGLPVLHELALTSLPDKGTSAKFDDPVQQDAPVVEPEIVEKEVYLPALVIKEPVRSGQRIYAENRDIICTATISAGAEVLADGNVHVYAPLRGRAYAGVSGDLNTGIFCKSLEAELVSVAGSYQVSEQFEKSIYKKNVHIYLQNNALRVTML